MARWWVLPASAAAFAVGVLAADAVSGDDGWLGLFELCGAAVLVFGAARGTDHEPSATRPLLESAGLVADPGPPSARERILAAAGIPTGLHRIGRSRWGALRVTALLVGVAVAGAGWSGVRAARAPPPADLAGRSVSFTGVAAGDVRATEYGWSVEADLEAAWGAEGSPTAEAVRVWANGSPPLPDVVAGTRIEGTGSLAPVPAGEGFGEYLRARGVVAMLDVSEMVIRGPPANPLLRAANAAREGLRRGALSVLPRREAGLLLGLAIGDTDLMDPAVEEDFRATGLGHLLAVSGSNVALFLAPILMGIVALRLRRSVRLIVALLAVAFFVLLTRWEPSVLRAGVMAGLALVGVWSGRPRHTGAILGAAVLLLLFVDPGLAASVGFQLSVAATVGLACLASPLALRLRWLPRPVALATAATLAAQVAVTPLLLLHFGVVPTATIVANVLAFPAVALALFGGIVAAAAALAWEPLGHAAGRLAALPLGYLVAVADRTAQLALPAVTSAGWMPPVAAGGLGFLVGWRIRRGRRPGGLLAAAVALGVVAWSSAPGAGPPSGLEAIFLDVGQGDAALVRTPDGAMILVDAGEDPDQVATELAGLGVRRLDLVVASHGHADHVGGFPAVLARHPVGLLLEPGCSADSPAYAELREAIEDEGVPVRHPRGGTTFWIGGLMVEILGPDACSTDSPNDDSVVIRVSYGGDSILFPGDAEVAAQEDLLEDGDPIEADVLKVPHHGGDTSTEAFFETTGATVAVVSTGPNDYGHPHPGVLATLGTLGMHVSRTDLGGDITVRFAGGDVLLESERA